MHFRRSFVHRVTVLSALGLIFTSAAFGQRLSPGSKPVETKVSRVLEAFCSNLSGGFRAGRIMKNEDRYAEFNIQKDSDTVSRVKPVLTDFAVTVTPGTTAPDVSATVPEIRPVSIWAHAGAYAAARATSARAKLNRTASLIDVSSA